jgi:hypothetical protein
VNLHAASAHEKIIDEHATLPHTQFDLLDDALVFGGGAA